MSRKTTAIVGGGVALILALAIAAFLYFFEKVSDEIRLPPRGAALYNPLFALERTLVAQGVVATSLPRLDLDAMQLRAGDGLVLYADPRRLTPAQVQALVAWIEAGGHLIVGLPDIEEGRFGDLLDRFGIAPTERNWHCQKLLIDPTKEPASVLCAMHRFELPADGALVAWGDRDNGYGYARLQRGRGTVDLAAELDFLSNYQLDELPQQRLAHQVLAPSLHGGRVFLIYDASVPSFWRLLMTHGWAALAGLGLMIALWIWMRSQRFGPLLPVEAADRRALLEHVQAAGEHAWRRGAARELHAALRDFFLARLRRRDPMAIALQGEARIDYLAKKLDLDATRIRNALVPPPTFHAESFREAMAMLIQMGLRL
ncbi:DUF4350 domain-containing protein [Arenimonas oryziterrae]|uniref:DUF4350 domain-containing protein n=1 Tax=Arenimonas oryziterrae DSM 21050 = YC6267 TaxID=1121015 RepID=A0A091AXF3_9GAMM|nr:DUF4350 domain-containing protein [Arenimonas oryziterrae]KFN44141.1 hypothetical protein N789_06915 [Arenimonas oryziterrae DSM 21050 = YC6267]